MDMLAFNIQYFITLIEFENIFTTIHQVKEVHSTSSSSAIFFLNKNLFAVVLILFPVQRVEAGCRSVICEYASQALSLRHVPYAMEGFLSAGQ